MASPAKERLEDSNTTTTTSVSISGPAYMVAVGGAPRGSRAKSKRPTGEECCITSRYLRPKTGSCHDKCKHGMQDEWLELRPPPKWLRSRITSRYLLPKTASCHDLCKHGVQDEWLEIRPAKRLGSRKKSFGKNKGIKRNVVPVERKKMMKTKPKPSPNPKVYVTAEPVGVTRSKNSLPSKKVGDSNEKEFKMPKCNPTTVKAKPMTSTLNAPTRLNGGKRGKQIKTIEVTRMVRKSTFIERVASKAIQNGSLVSKPSGSKAVSLKGNNQPTNQMTKTKLKQLIAEKVSEMALHEIVQPPPTLETKPTSPPDSESNPSSFDQEVVVEESSIIAPLSEDIQTSSDEQGSKMESEHADDEEVVVEECEYADDEENIILEDDYEIETSEGKIPRRYRVVICEDDDESKLKFRRGRVLEPSDDDGPSRLKFRSGRILDDEDTENMVRLNFKKHEVEAADDCKQSENVKLKHQEVQEKEVQELLNSVIEETASKLLEDMKKHKVEALVGAFETVISRTDDTVSSSTESKQTN